MNINSGNGMSFGFGRGASRLGFCIAVACGLLLSPVLRAAETPLAVAPASAVQQTTFKTPEEAKLEYVMLTQDALLAQVAITPEEVKAQYASAAKSYTQDEQRQAAHILIAVKPDATDDQKAAAKKRAEEIAAQAKKNPAQFAELAVVGAGLTLAVWIPVFLIVAVTPAAAYGILHLTRQPR